VTLQQLLLPAALAGSLASVTAAPADRAAAAVDRAVAAIQAAPQYTHANIGVEAIDLATGRVIYARSADRFFVPGSTTKLVTVGAALALLGPDHRFHTRVYRTGPVGSDGLLDGDLVLAASGDPNLSNRMRPDGTLAFNDEDHSYGGKDVRPVDGDPLAVIDELAAQIAAHGIKRVAGRVRVDIGLFPEKGQEGGSGVYVSPVVVNDNVVDLMIEAGPAAGAPVGLRVQPLTGYLRVVNRATTGAAGSKATVDITSDEEGADGTHTITLTGTAPAGERGLIPYAVPRPSRFAAVVLAEALQAHGVVAAPGPAVVATAGEPADTDAGRGADHLVAEHVSAPFSEAARVVLKVSENLHATILPSVLGATLAAGKEGPPLQRGFDLMKQWLDGSGVDVSGASQGDGAGARAHFTPHFMASYLAWMARQPFAAVFRRALPVMGRDGTLADIQKSSPAAGHVFAKTGTYEGEDRLTRAIMVDGKGLAGYVDTHSGRTLAFAAYINFARVTTQEEVANDGERLGEIASALYAAY
jgi:PBP4 family serine-type D-alanyl-D-alanine carboxypeptidase